MSLHKEISFATEARRAIEQPLQIPHTALIAAAVTGRNDVSDTLDHL